MKRQQGFFSSKYLSLHIFLIPSGFNFYNLAMAQSVLKFCCGGTGITAIYITLAVETSDH